MDLKREKYFSSNVDIFCAVDMYTLFHQGHNFQCFLQTRTWIKTQTGGRFFCVLCKTQKRFPGLNDVVIGCVIDGTMAGLTSYGEFICLSLMDVGRLKHIVSI